MAKGERTVRFAQVVEKAGCPTTYLLWTEPSVDRKFQRAVSDNLVMTVHRELRGTHADYGVVGYQPGQHAQFLLFPNSLRRFKDRRIVGIDYELLASGTEAGSASAIAVPARSDSPEAIKPIKTKPTPNIVHFPGKDVAGPVKPRRKPVRSAQPLKPSMHLDRQTAGQIREAVRELKTGRYVAAYTRLNALLTPRA